MSEFPDFSNYGYRVEKELGHNRAGGRVTYLAIDIEPNYRVVIKQFQLAKLGANWSGYDAYNREIQLLKELDHPGIPRYLDAFQTPDGFCMVQEYKDAESLSATRSFNPDQIKQIAIAALAVLVYLQNRIPAVIHRDIKPDNVLVDQAGNVYLVDFGFAHVGEGEVGVSSVVKGTLGFMPPEQLFNRQLTEASDLYGLGMALICLLTGTKADNIGDLVDISYRVSFKHLVPKLNQHWVNWLEKMVEPRLKDRFPNALTALESVPQSPLRPPEAQFSHPNLELKASRPGEQITHSVTITNPIPDTILEGQWEVASHPHDPPNEIDRWISIDPVSFVGNKVECQIHIDTHKLMIGKTYHRRLVLRANTLAKAYPLTLQIQTAPGSFRSNLLPYGVLSILSFFALGISWLVGWIIVITGTVSNSIEIVGLAAVLGSGIGLELSAWLMQAARWRLGSTTSRTAAIAVGSIVVIAILASDINASNPIMMVGVVIGVIFGAIAGIALGTVAETLTAKGYTKGLAIAASLLTSSLGISLGLGFATNFTNASILALLAVSSIASTVAMTYLQLQQMNSGFYQQKKNRHLIRP